MMRGNFPVLFQRYFTYGRCSVVHRDACTKLQLRDHVERKIREHNRRSIRGEHAGSVR